MNTGSAHNPSWLWWSVINISSQTVDPAISSTQVHVGCFTKDLSNKRRDKITNNQLILQVRDSGIPDKSSHSSLPSLSSCVSQKPQNQNVCFFKQGEKSATVSFVQSDQKRPFVKTENIPTRATTHCQRQMASSGTNCNRARTTKTVPFHSRGNVFIGLIWRRVSGLFKMLRRRVYGSTSAGAPLVSVRSSTPGRWRMARVSGASPGVQWP